MSEIILPRTQAAKPLNINVLNASMMILPPLASQLDARIVPEFETGESYVYGDIVRSGKNYYWCITAAGGVAGANAPVQTDGDASDGTLTWRYVRWFRTAVSFVQTAAAGKVCIARGNAAEMDKGIVLTAYGSHSEGYDGLRPYEGAWYAISDDAGGRLLAISEG